MKQPGQNIKVGHPGVGSFGHLADVLIMQELGVKVTQVPYRGAGPALVDLLHDRRDLRPRGSQLPTQRRGNQAQHQRTRSSVRER